MKFRVNNLVAGKVEIFDTEQEAVTKNQEVIDEFLARESYRFTIAKEVVDGDNTTWMNADLTNDQEDAVYHVFNTLTGTHEQVSGLLAAKARQDEIKQAFLIHANVNAPQEISDEEALQFIKIV